MKTIYEHTVQELLDAGMRVRITDQKGSQLGDQRRMIEAQCLAPDASIVAGWFTSDEFDHSGCRAEKGGLTMVLL